MKFLLTLVLILGGLNAQAQDKTTFQIRDGKVGISIYYQDTLLNIGSHKLRMMINNVNMEVVIAVSPNTFSTGIDSLDLKLREGSQNDVVFRGVLGLDQLWTKNKSTQHFDAEGELTLNGRTESVVLKGALSDFQVGPNLDCMMYLHYDITLSDFGLDETLPDGFAETGCMEILQPLSLPTSRDQ
ncbi:MAG: hypothetical protein K9J17_15340 [Flavobacteriales bacterium]|nr:hypothetical protein [Flavobacteriales bacterium]